MHTIRESVNKMHSRSKAKLKTAWLTSQTPKFPVSNTPELRLKSTQHAGLT